MNLFTELKRRNVIRVAIAYVAGSWLLIQVVETIFPLFGFSDAAARLIVIGLAVGFVPALVFAWAFQLTPQGLKFDSEVAQAESVVPQTGKLLDRVIMVTLALAVGYFAFDKFVLDPAEDVEIAQEAEQRGRSEALIESHGDKSIAVLPFVNMSPDPDQAYFADGISEELLNLLAKIPELRVISRSSAFSFRGDDINVRDVADQLDVSHVLEGSVRKSGNRIRITAQLIEARTDTHLWSETYERELGDIFDIQDEIATVVVGELESRLLDQLPPSKRTHPETYALFLQARGALSGLRDPEHAARAELLLERALELNPDYAPAWVLLGTAILRQTRGWGGEKYSKEESSRLYNAALENGLAADPEDALVNVHVGLNRLIDDLDSSEGLRMLEKAIAKEPNNVEVVRTGAQTALVIGHFEEAARLARRTIELDPLCNLCYLYLTRAYLRGGRLEEAEEVARRRVKLFDYGHLMLAKVLLIKGEPEPALAIADEILEDGSDGNANQGLMLRAMALFSLGQVDESREIIAEWIQRFGDIDPFGAGEFHAWTGDIDAAFGTLDMLFTTDNPEYRWDFLNQIAWDLVYRNLHDDPRWRVYWGTLGTSPEELQAIEFNVNLPKFR